MSNHWKVFSLVANLFCASAVCAGDVKNSAGGFLDFNLYPYLTDVDNDSVFTLNIASALPNRFSYFSLMNISNQANAAEFSDTVGFYTEQNLRWKISDNSPIDLTLQYNMRSGEENDRTRLGFRWRLSDTGVMKDFLSALHVVYSINFHLLQLDDENENIWQMEHVLWVTFPGITDRLYLSAFADHTFNEDLPNHYPSDPIVSEAQLGYRLLNNLYFVSEYRLNEYRRSDVNNVALGLEYKVKW